jgi:hypothetical protein
VERGYRPYWVHYTAPEIIGWRYSTIGNRRVFTQLRIRENSIEPMGEFGEAEVERIKVYDLSEGRCRYRLFQEIDGNWMQVGENGFLSLPYIPFTFIYTDKKRDSVTRPPMLEVAYLNINHFNCHPTSTIVCISLLILSWCYMAITPIKVMWLWVQMKHWYSTTQTAEQSGLHRPQLRLMD